MSCVAKYVCGFHAERGNEQCVKVQESLQAKINEAKIELLRTTPGPCVQPRCRSCGNPCICGVLT